MSQHSLEVEWRNATRQFLASPEGRDFPTDDPVNREIVVRYMIARGMVNATDKLKALKLAYKRLKKMGMLR